MHELIRFNGSTWITTGRRHDFGGDTPPNLSPNKGKWVLVVVNAQPVFDPKIERLDQSTVVTETEVTISFAKVTRQVTGVKQEKRDELRQEALRLINVVFPAINDMDELALIREQWQSIAPAAKQATPSFQKMLDTFIAARNAITTINGLATPVAVNNYDVVNDPTWP